MATIFDQKNILVLGGAGFIGSHVCDALIKDNKVICIDNFLSGEERNIEHLLSNPNFAFIKHDLSEPLDLDQLPELDKFRVKFQGIQEIYNLACPTSPKDFTEVKIQTLMANSLVVKNSLDMAVKYKAKFLQFSSSVVYGPRTSNKPVSEQEYGVVDPLTPRGCYDEGKRFAETMVDTYRDRYDLETKIIRVFRTYGPRMKLHNGHMIPDFVSNGLTNEDIIIYGDENFSTSMIYVNDVVAAAIKLMDSTFYGPFNIGSDEIHTLTSVAEKVKEMLNSKSKIVYSKPLLFMSPLVLPDSSAAKDQLGWFPVVLLEEGLQNTIDYLKASQNMMSVTDLDRKL